MKNSIKEEIPQTTHHAADLMEVLTTYNVQTKNASVWMPTVPGYTEQMLYYLMEGRTALLHVQVNLGPKPTRRL